MNIAQTPPVIECTSIVIPNKAPLYDPQRFRCLTTWSVVAQGGDVSFALWLQHLKTRTLLLSLFTVGRCNCDPVVIEMETSSNSSSDVADLPLGIFLREDVFAMMRRSKPHQLMQFQRTGEWCTTPNMINLFDEGQCLRAWAMRYVEALPLSFVQLTKPLGSSGATNGRIELLFLCRGERNSGVQTSMNSWRFGTLEFGEVEGVVGASQARLVAEVGCVSSSVEELLGDQIVSFLREPNWCRCSHSSRGVLTFATHPVIVTLNSSSGRRVRQAQDVRLDMMTDIAIGVQRDERSSRFMDHQLKHVLDGDLEDILSTSDSNGEAMFVVFLKSTSSPSIASPEIELRLAFIQPVDVAGARGWSGSHVSEECLHIGAAHVTLPAGMSPVSPLRYCAINEAMLTVNEAAEEHAAFSCWTAVSDPSGNFGAFLWELKQCCDEVQNKEWSRTLTQAALSVTEEMAVDAGGSGSSLTECLRLTISQLSDMGSDDAIGLAWMLLGCKANPLSSRHANVFDQRHTIIQSLLSEADRDVFGSSASTMIEALVWWVALNSIEDVDLLFDDVWQMCSNDTGKKSTIFFGASFGDNEEVNAAISSLGEVMRAICGTVSQFVVNCDKEMKIAKRLFQRGRLLEILRQSCNALAVKFPVNDQNLESNDVIASSLLLADVLQFDSTDRFAQLSNVSECVADAFLQQVNWVDINSGFPWSVLHPVERLRALEALATRAGPKWRPLTAIVEIIISVCENCGAAYADAATVFLSCFAHSASPSPSSPSSTEKDYDIRRAWFAWLHVDFMYGSIDTNCGSFNITDVLWAMEDIKRLGKRADVSLGTLCSGMLRTLTIDCREAVSTDKRLHRLMLISLMRSVLSAPQDTCNSEDSYQTTLWSEGLCCVVEVLKTLARENNVSDQPHEPGDISVLFIAPLISAVPVSWIAQKMPWVSSTMRQMPPCFGPVHELAKWCTDDITMTSMTLGQGWNLAVAVSSLLKIEEVSPVNAVSITEFVEATVCDAAMSYLFQRTESSTFEFMLLSPTAVQEECAWLAELASQQEHHSIAQLLSMLPCAPVFAQDVLECDPEALFDVAAQHTAASLTAGKASFLGDDRAISAALAYANSTVESLREILSISPLLTGALDVVAAAMAFVALSQLPSFSMGSGQERNDAVAAFVRRGAVDNDALTNQKIGQLLWLVDRCSLSRTLPSRVRTCLERTLPCLSRCLTKLHDPRNNIVVVKDTSLRQISTSHATTSLPKNKRMREVLHQTLNTSSRNVPKMTPPEQVPAEGPSADIVRPIIPSLTQQLTALQRTEREERSILEATQVSECQAVAHHKAHSVMPPLLFYAYSRQLVNTMAAVWLDQKVSHGDVEHQYWTYQSEEYGLRPILEARVREWNRIQFDMEQLLSSEAQTRLTLTETSLSTMHGVCSWAQLQTGLCLEEENARRVVFNEQVDVRRDILDVEGEARELFEQHLLRVRQRNIVAQKRLMHASLQEHGQRITELWIEVSLRVAEHATEFLFFFEAARRSSIQVQKIDEAQRLRVAREYLSHHVETSLDLWRETSLAEKDLCAQLLFVEWCNVAQVTNRVGLSTIVHEFASRCLKEHTLSVSSWWATDAIQVMQLGKTHMLSLHQSSGNRLHSELKQTLLEQATKPPAAAVAVVSTGWDEADDDLFEEDAITSVPATAEEAAQHYQDKQGLPPPGQGGWDDDLDNDVLSIPPAPSTLLPSSGSEGVPLSGSGNEPPHTDNEVAQAAIGDSATGTVGCSSGFDGANVVTDVVTKEFKSAPDGAVSAQTFGWEDGDLDDAVLTAVVTESQTLAQPCSGEVDSQRDVPGAAGFEVPKSSGWEDDDDMFEDAFFEQPKHSKLNEEHYAELWAQVCDARDRSECDELVAIAKIKRLMDASLARSGRR